MQRLGYVARPRHDAPQARARRREARVLRVSKIAEMPARHTDRPLVEIAFPHDRPFSPVETTSRKRCYVIGGKELLCSNFRS